MLFRSASRLHQPATLRVLPQRVVTEMPQQCRQCVDLAVNVPDDVNRASEELSYVLSAHDEEALLR